MFVVVRAKSNLAVLNGNLRKRPPASIHLREHLRQLGDVGGDAARLVFARRTNRRSSYTTMRMPEMAVKLRRQRPLSGLVSR
jgi:hypothetical protein